MRPGTQVLLVQAVSARLVKLGLDPTRLRSEDLERLAVEDAEEVLDAATLLRRVAPLYQAATP